MNESCHDPDDTTLINASLAGDDAAFATLVSRHKGRVFGIASRFCRERHDLDDLCQEIFIRVYRKLGSFRAEAPFEHWVSRIAVRACYDFLRRAKRQPPQVPMEEVSAVLADLAAERNAEQQQVREVLDSALGRLGARERLVITLLEIENRSVSEVAALTGWSAVNVKVRAFRARRALRDVLKEYYDP